MDNVEIEFKILLDKETYLKIVDDFKDQIHNDYVQVNYYLFHEALDSIRYAMRIRYKMDKYELTLKTPAKIGLHEYNLDIDEETKNKIFNHEEVNNYIFDMLKEKNIDYRELDCGSYLTTHRIDICLDHGVLSLDDNTYLNHQDYELEFEVDDYDEGKKVFDELCKKYSLDYQGNCLSKIKRFKKVKDHHC